jgi:hypothetical protein
MEQEERLKILKQLSQIKGDKPVVALAIELEKDSKTLFEATDYYELKRAIDSISVYAFRVYEKSLLALTTFIDRIENRGFICETPYLPSNFDPYAHLLIDVMQVIEKFRYFDLRKTISIFARFCIHQDKLVRKKATEGLEACVRFDLYIFYKGHGRAGLGLSPQRICIEYLEEEKTIYLEGDCRAATILASELLSTSMEGSSWDYQSVTFEKGAVPFSVELSEIRARTLNFLFEIYNAQREDSEKKAIISTAFSAMAPPEDGELTQELRTLIVENGLTVLSWVKSIIPGESYPVLQKLEHDVYWRFYHGLSDEIRKSALEIRDLILSNPEYLKYRVLVGYESVFEDWKDSLTQESDFSKIGVQRSEQARQLANSITVDTWQEWEPRILAFSRTKSEDHATFPIFYDFLTRVATQQPDLMLGFVKDHGLELGHFQFYIFVGLLKTESAAVWQYFVELASKGQSLAYVARALSDANRYDKQLIEQIFQSANAANDGFAMSQILQVVIKQFGKTYNEEEKTYLIDSLFIPAIRKLTDLRSYLWIDQVWYVREAQEVFRSLDGKDVSNVLQALEALPDIDYHAEELLKALAANHPAQVIEFFGRRISARKSVDGYTAIPFSFHHLHEVLSANANLLVQIVHSWGSHNDGLFRFFGGQFIANVFPSLGENLENALLPYAMSGNVSDAKFVLGILQNYVGQPFVHKLCRELIVAHYETKEITQSVGIVLQTTGVVMGEYGFADAYANKAKEIEYWTEDKNPHVVNFAKTYIEHLRSAEERERKRSTEEIELRKHKFGVREDNADG